jgi:hypothetical protein
MDNFISTTNENLNEALLNAVENENNFISYQKTFRNILLNIDKKSKNDKRLGDLGLGEIMRNAGEIFSSNLSNIKVLSGNADEIKENINGYIQRGEEAKLAIASQGLFSFMNHFFYINIKKDQDGKMFIEYFDSKNRSITFYSLGDLLDNVKSRHSIEQDDDFSCGYFSFLNFVQSELNELDKDNHTIKNLNKMLEEALPRHKNAWIKNTREELKVSNGLFGMIYQAILTFFGIDLGLNKQYEGENTKNVTWEEEKARVHNLVYLFFLGGRILENVKSFSIEIEKEKLSKKNLFGSQKKTVKFNDIVDTKEYDLDDEERDYKKKKLSRKYEKEDLDKNDSVESDLRIAILEYISENLTNVPKTEEEFQKIKTDLIGKVLENEYVKKIVEDKIQKDKSVSCIEDDLTSLSSMDSPDKKEYDLLEETGKNPNDKFDSFTWITLDESKER